jgi:CDP-diacylglycerol--serine O-phosphatidyltransferase
MPNPETRKDDDTPDSILLVDEHIEEVSEGGQQVRHRGVYLLPNLFTTAALFCGFYAIIASIHGKFEHAAVAIFAAMVFDGLDGRIARLTNTTSAFGVQYDSLSDMVSFGVAPALVSFNWALSLLGKVGWSIAFLYATCAALRLARFNTQVDTADKNYFTGLASPAAAAIIAGMVWVGADNEIAMTWILAIAVCIIVCLAALLMVSNIKYYSFKGIDFKARVPFIVILALVLVVTLVHIDPPKVLLAIMAFYALSGPVMHVYRRGRPEA